MGLQLMSHSEAYSNSYSTFTNSIAPDPLLRRASADKVVATYFELTSRAFPRSFTDHKPGAHIHKSRQNAGLTSVADGTGFAIKTVIGEQIFDLFVDTGSSDTWIVETGFQCLTQNGNSLPEGDCSFGSTYNVTDTFKPVKNEFFRTGYGSGEFVLGTLGQETVTLAGVAVEATIASVYQAYYLGDGVTSGILGLAYPNITGSFSGTNTSIHTIDNQVPYDPVFTTMWKSGKIPPVFSLALDRSTSGTAGYLALGGLPPILYVPNFVSTPLLITTITGLPRTFNYYTIVIDSTVVDCACVGGTTKGSVSRNAKYVVDSGTNYNLVPSDIATAINAAFIPAAVYNEDTGNSDVSCDAEVPSVGIAIGGTAFYMDDLDLIITQKNIDGTESCYSAFIDGGNEIREGFFILGSNFMRNVISVFDVGAGQMRFAARTLRNRAGKDKKGRVCLR